MHIPTGRLPNVLQPIIQPRRPYRGPPHRVRRLRLPLHRGECPHIYCGTDAA